MFMELILRTRRMGWESKHGR